MNSPGKMLEMQMQIRENAAELGDYLRDLDAWQTNIKEQDKTFAKMKPKQEQKLLAPVRGSSIAKKNKVRDKCVEEKPKRINSYDFKSWDKLDVDQMLEDIDIKEEQEEAKKQEEIAKNFVKLSLDEKNKGNDHFKSGRYEKSIECYTKGMQYDPSNPILPANRAMAYLKLKRYIESEADCTLSLSLDPVYVKAYLRRGAARNAMGKVESAVRDFTDALKLEPDNKQAKREMESIKKQGNKDRPAESTDTEKELFGNKMKRKRVLPINKAEKLRSKKPLRRINVEEIGRVDAKTKAESVNEHIQSNHCSDNDLSSRQSISDNKPLIKEVDRRDSIASDEKSAAAIPSSSVCADSARVSAEQSLIPPPPHTCFQFQADVRKLKSHCNALYQYLLQIQPVEIPTLLKDQLDTDMLCTILNCFNHCKNTSTIFVFDFLTFLSKAKRFDMAVLFLTNSDKKVLHSLRDQLNQKFPDKTEVLTKLFASYGLKS